MDSRCHRSERDESAEGTVLAFIHRLSEVSSSNIAENHVGKLSS